MHRTLCLLSSFADLFQKQEVEFLFIFDKRETSNPCLSGYNDILQSQLFIVRKKQWGQHTLVATTIFFKTLNQLLYKKYLSH